MRALRGIPVAIGAGTFINWWGIVVVTLPVISTVKSLRYGNFILTATV